jgi:hypothetical protein
MTTMSRLIISFLIFLIHPILTYAQPVSKIIGEWRLIPQQSSEISLFNGLSLDISSEQEEIRIVRTWGSRRSHTDTLAVRPGRIVTVPVHHRVFPSNVFMGLSMDTKSGRRLRSSWDEGNKQLVIEESFRVLSSQGPQNMRAVHTFHLSVEDILTYTLQRSTRSGAPPIHYTLKRKGEKNAFVMHLEDDWAIDGKLPEHAFLISLQGLANRAGPRLYFVYPEKWDFRFTPDVLKYYKERHYTFRTLRSASQALTAFSDQIKGYVVWDTDVRTSLIVAFTAAGLEDAVVVSEALLPMVRAAGLKSVADFRGKFRGLSDAEIYEWAYDRYWDRCSKSMIVWMGGEHGRIMKPGVADWGIYNRAFFHDSSNKPSDTREYALSKRLLSELKPMSLVFGWHSYKKDKERDHVTLTSSFGHRVEGLHTLPNMSFSSQVPPSPGFKFRNNHQLKPNQTLRPDKKVYIACIQTDCLGLGAWTQPGRGEIPYAWEVTMNWVWLAPAMMEFFYSQATPNDYFIGALSGPGYLYPKAVPPHLLTGLINKAAELMEILDLNIFEIMDYSEGATVEGNTELTKRVVEAYYRGMPRAIGFVNGYAPAFTFTVRDDRPLISYDYYLSPSRSEDDAVADIEELAAINSKRPYFLLMHVRQWSDIKRVKAILDRLGSAFEVVPLDIFMHMAGQYPTFKERFLDK